MTRLLDVTNLQFSAPPRHRSIFHPEPRRKILDNINFSVDSGETLGIIGASGSGKSTLGKLIAGILKPDRGIITFHNEFDNSDRPDTGRSTHDHIQMVFQDPRSALDPRQTVERIVGEPLHRLALGVGEKHALIQQALDDVALPPDAATRLPHSFSGGQRQRIAIARALVTRPKIIVADEAVSALDVFTQAIVLNLLLALQKKYGVSYIFISHDLAVIRHMSHRIAVLDQGRIVEQGRTEDVMRSPQTTATKTFLDASY